MKTWNMGLWVIFGTVIGVLTDQLGLWLAWGQLVPGGWLLVTRNDRRVRGSLAELALEAAARAGGGVESIEEARPSIDFPHLAGFPEGDPFEGQLLRKS